MSDRRHPDETEEGREDKESIQSYVTSDEKRLIGLAAVETSKSRAAFCANASVEKAVAVLRDKNPSALDGTPFELAKAS